MINSRVYNGYKTKMCMKHPNCSHGNKCTFAHSPEELLFKETVDEKYYKHFSVIVESGIITEKDLRTRYLQAFIACSWNVTEAVRTLRFVRNILCHMKGVSQGIGRGLDVFNCLWQLVACARQCVDHASEHTKIKIPCMPVDVVEHHNHLVSSHVKSIVSCSHQDVLGLFERCKFPTQGSNINQGWTCGRTDTLGPL